MKTTITIYEKPTCSTCRLAEATLRDIGVEFDKVNYYEEPLTEARLKMLLKKMGLPAHDLLRTRETLYKELELGEKRISEAEAVRLMVKYPDLMQRPIIEKGDIAILGRPPENLKKLIKG